MIAVLMGLALTVKAGNGSVEWDRQSLIIDGRRVCPVMGEVHYSRIPAEEWATSTGPFDPSKENTMYFDAPDCRIVCK